MQPLQTQLSQPGRGPFGRAGDKIEGPADPNENCRGSTVHIAGNPLILLGRTISDKDHIGPGGLNLGYNFVFILRPWRAGKTAGHDQTGIAAGQNFNRLLGHPRLSAQKKEPISPLGRASGQRLHHVYPGHPLR